MKMSSIVRGMALILAAGITLSCNDSNSDLTSANNDYYSSSSSTALPASDDSTTTTFMFSEFQQYRCATGKIIDSQRIPMITAVTIKTSAKTKLSKVCEKIEGKTYCNEGYSKSSGTDGLGAYTLYSGVNYNGDSERDYIYTSGSFARMENVTESLCFKYYK